MKTLRLAVLSCLAVLASAGQSHAESLQCSGGSVGEGDSRAAVLYKCGEPALKDSFCTPFYAPSPYPGGPPVAVYGLPCVPVDEWIYERGPGNLVATLRFQYGKVYAIRYGQTPR